MIEFLTYVHTHINFAAASVSIAFTQSPKFIIEAFVYAVIGGVFPALIWLWFWMHENHAHHEPRNTIWLTFLVGMCGVFVVYPFQKAASFLIGEETTGWLTFVSWAALEEIVKFGAAYFIALQFREDIFDEPIDAFVYLMTAALGFSAMENVLFLIGPLLQGETLTTILTGNMRFMGANLLHVASSGILSLFISFTYFMPIWKQRLSAFVGLISATLIHAIFNYFIMLITETNKDMIFIAFSYVWITLIILILALEKVKTIKQF